MNLPRLRSRTTSTRKEEQRGLRLWPVGPVLTGTFVVALGTATLVFTAGWHLLGVQGLKPEHRLTSQTLFDLVKLAFGVVAGAGGLVALVVAYRRQRVDEDGALREATRLHTERFTTAVTQLGDPSPAVRLGGVHALTHLADDAPTRALRQTCIDVLCAYLRLPYTPETDLPDGDSTARHDYLALRQARHTIIRLIRDHLRLDRDHPHTWQGHDFDFTGVVFDGGDLSHARFSGSLVTFADARFSGGLVDFTGAHFISGTVTFAGAHFTGSTVNFSEARFTGSTVDFTGAHFTGSTVNFSEARFSGSLVTFAGALLSGGLVDFTGAHFTGSTVDFTGAHFTGSTVDCAGARFSGGTVRFNNAYFSGGTVIFTGARFTGGTVTFASGLFSGGTVRFNNAYFSGGTVIFTGAPFTGGTVRFTGAHFTGSTVRFTDAGSRPASGVVPNGPVPADGTPLPSGLHLPAEWYPNAQ